jgi:hypothetical protein
MTTTLPVVEGFARINLKGEVEPQLHDAVGGRLAVWRHAPPRQG